MKPNYICIGVQKGGTHSLSKFLNYHPEIYLADKVNEWEKNERHFFDRPVIDGELTNKDIDEYENSFITNKPIIGEKTPSYNYLRYAMDRIYNYDKNMKLIILLREPIARAFSHYNMTFEKKMDKVTDQEILKHLKKDENLKLIGLQSNGDPGSRNIIRGFYDEILEYILSKFPRKNIYIGVSEEINSNKFKYYNEIYTFLGAKPLESIDENLNCHIGSYKKSIPKTIERYLYQIYKTHNEKLYKIIGRRIDIWDNYYNQIECSLVKELNFLNEELEETKRKLDKTIKDLSETQNQLKRLTNDNLQKDEKISTVEN